MTKLHGTHRLSVFIGVLLLLVGATMIILTEVSFRSHKTTQRVMPPAPHITMDTPRSHITPTAENNCAHLLEVLNTYNWQTPDLSSAILSKYATPSLVRSILAVPHMSLGEITQRWHVTPDIILLATQGTTVDTLVAIDMPYVGAMTYRMDCVTQGGVVTQLEPVGQ